MTSRNNRKNLSGVELDAVLSYVGCRADLARQKGTKRAIVDELIVQLLAKAGLRPNELSALIIGDLPGTHGETALWIRDMSGGIARKVTISEDLAQRLARFVRFYRNGAQTEDRLLESERGTPLSYMSLYSRLRRIGREVGITQLSPAALRQTYVQQLYETTGDLRYVQQQAGYAGRRSMAQHIKAKGDPENTGRDCRKIPEKTLDGPGAKDPVQTPTCEACGTIILAGGGKRIESGQLLCKGCLQYFQKT